MKLLSKDLIDEKFLTDLDVSENDDLRLYIVINKDILNSEMVSRGKEDAQVGHAVEIFTELLYNSISENPSILKIYKQYLKNRKKIVLEADDKTCMKLDKLGYVTVRDYGLTEIPENSLTALCIGILSKNADLKEIKRLQLRK